MEHSGKYIGLWLQDACNGVGCLPSYIGSHMVGGTNNTGKVVEVLKWNTGNKRSLNIMSSKCDTYKINTTGKRACGTSSRKVNLNPELDSH